MLVPDVVPLVVPLPLSSAVPPVLVLALAPDEEAPPLWSAPAVLPPPDSVPGPEVEEPPVEGPSVPPRSPDVCAHPKETIESRHSRLFNLERSIAFNVAKARVRVKGGTLCKMTTSLVTGTNRGIGLELARQLKERGHHVIATCRKSSPELDALGVQVEAEIDVSDPASVRALVDRLGDISLDLLINNAGLLAIESLGELDFASIQRQFEINALGPLRITQALLPRMHAGSKIALITSRMGSIADNGSGGAYGYRMSKAALNIAGVSLAKDLTKRQIAVAIVHPGMVATDMTARFGHSPTMQKPDETATKLLARIDALTMETTGTFWHANGEKLPW